FFPHPQRLFCLPRYLPLKWQWIKKEWSAIAAWLALVMIIEGIMERQNFFSTAYLKELLVLGLSFIISGGFFIRLLSRYDSAKS
ncbi:MAG: hypothetical protein ACOY3D_08110, partial [Candidatus Omnitrophota bacterium]